MLVARFDFDIQRDLDKTCNNLNLEIADNFTKVLVIGDSMVKFLKDSEYRSVISKGGARILDLLPIICSELKMLTIHILLLHVGTNDVNKVFRHGDYVTKQAIHDFDYLCVQLSNMQRSFKGRVAISTHIGLQE